MITSRMIKRSKLIVEEKKKAFFFRGTPSNIEEGILLFTNVKVRASRSFQEHGVALFYCHRKNINRLKKRQHIWLPAGVNANYKAVSHVKLREIIKSNEL